MNPTAVQLIGALLLGIAIVHTFSSQLFERLAYKQPRHGGIWHPAGFSIMRGSFCAGAIQPRRLLLAATPPTLMVMMAFRLL